MFRYCSTTAAGTTKPLSGVNFMLSDLQSGGRDGKEHFALI